MPAPDFTTARECLNDEIADFIATNKTTQERITMIEKPKDDSQNHTHFGSGNSKQDRYGWAEIQGELPTVQMIRKSLLYIDRGYQRDARPSDDRVRRIAATFNWNRFAAITVSKRGGRYMVVDGQNRLLACMKRKEIDMVPCCIQSHSGSEINKQAAEAAAFLGINTTAKGVSAFDKHRAGLIAKDQNTMLTQAALDAGGVVLVRNSKGPNETAAAAETAKLVRQIGKDAVARALAVCKNMVFPEGIPARALLAVSYLLEGVAGGADERLVAKLISIGGAPAEILMHKMILVAGKSGPAVTGEALRQAVNNGLRSNRYEFKK